MHRRHQHADHGMRLVEEASEGDTVHPIHADIHPGEIRLQTGGKRQYIVALPVSPTMRRLDTASSCTLKPSRTSGWSSIRKRRLGYGRVSCNHCRPSISVWLDEEPRHVRDDNRIAYLECHSQGAAQRSLMTCKPTPPQALAWSHSVPKPPPLSTLVSVAAWGVTSSIKAIGEVRAGRAVLVNASCVRRNGAVLAGPRRTSMLGIGIA